MKSPFHHLKHPEWFFEYFHKKIHHAFGIFALAIIWMLWGASHILTPTSANWQWWWFITSDFWEQSPTDGNIKYALFGDGSAWATAYTRLWDSSCIPTTIQYLPTSFAGGTLSSNTIYILNSWTYLLNAPIRIGSCSALLGKWETILIPTNTSVTPIVYASWENNVIIHNIQANGNNIISWWISSMASTNVSLNNVKSYKNIEYWFSSIWSSKVLLNASQIFSNPIWVNNLSRVTINNCLIYNNNLWVKSYFWTISINNSQIFNNITWAGLSLSFWTTNNSLIYNNSIYWMFIEWGEYSINNSTIYNNGTWISLNKAPFPLSTTWYLTWYWTIKLFGNTNNLDIVTGNSFDMWTTSPAWLSRSAGQLDTWSTTIDYDRVTNPQNGSGQLLISGSNRTSLRWPQTFDTTKYPIRYIFWWNILKQIAPVRYNSSSLESYGNDWSDYFTTRYITEPESSLSAEYQAIVNQYFGSGSLYTENRGYNWCSLSAFQVKTLNPGTFSSTYNFEDHTIYLLSGGEYLSTVGWAGNSFVFNGNCIALVGTPTTRFTKSNMVGLNSVLYANDKRNIIIDTIKADATYSNGTTPSASAQSVIKLDGASNNSTINNVQAYNASLYGIFLGQSSHHNTIINTQVFNNLSAGIYLYYSSNYNVINNTQAYNNYTYGIWFANGSNRNTMNNFQAYNNTVWVFWDLTTQENILNRAAIYNNSEAGIYFKNASGNVVNDVKIYHNTIGIKTLFGSVWNKYYGSLSLMDNIWGNFDGTNGNDGVLSPGSAWLFAYGGTLTTGTSTMTCLDATNPILSGNGLLLLTDGTCTNMWFVSTFRSEHNTYVNYAFWLNVYKQKIPVRYDSWNSLIQIPSQYDSGKYIAEIFAIWDDTPESVNFLWSGAAELNTWYTTNIYTAGVLNITVPVTLSFDPSTTSGYLIISWNTVGLTGTVSNQDTIQIALLTRAWYNETVTWSITIWTVTTWFVVTTRGRSQTPTTGSFAFSNFTSILLNTFTGSTTTIAGIETGVFAWITFAPSTTSGRLEIYSGWALVNSWTTWLLVYNGNQVKAIAQSSSGYAQTVTWYVTIWLGTGEFTIKTKWSDSTPPTTPVLTYPLSGEEIFFVTFQWTASTDTWSGIEWYMYEIAEDSNFLDVINTGFIATETGTMGSPNTEFDAINGSYYWRMKAKDKDDNYSDRSNSWSFEAISFDGRDFNEKTNANLRTYYDSEEITLEGIKPWLSVWASVDEDTTLYKNGSDRGTGVFVQNGDDIYISVRSSSSYDRTIYSTLTIANRALEFAVTTKNESDSECTLSDDDMDTVQTIFDSLVENYSGEASRYDEFLYTMQSMLSDEIDFTNDCNLSYLQTLIQDTLGITQGSISTGNHIAPNCKEYAITYDSSRLTYTSPTLTRITYFANRDSLTRYIDSKNPGDCHINTYWVSSWVFTNNDPSEHIAPNGKIYAITMESGKYTSTNFVYKKYFNTITELRSYIDKNNTPSEIWNHQVDTSFTPQIYIAPNGKEYKIYKTDRWYMSYKLMKVRYFSSLWEIQYYISTNNK